MSAGSYRKPLTLLTILFFMWGSITSLNDILIPHLKGLFELSYTQVMLVQFCFFTAYFVMSVPGGKYIAKFGYKSGIMFGLNLAGMGCLLFLPASYYISFPMFLFALFVLASGITVLQVAANPYVAILGDPDTASSRLNLTQALNSFGTFIAPILGAYFILSETVQNINEKAESVQLPYFILAVTLFLIALLFKKSSLPKIEEEVSEKNNSDDFSMWSFKQLKFGTIGIFLYVGAEVSIGSFMVNFLAEESIAGLSEASAGKYVAYYWGAAMVGRFIGAAVLQKIPAQKVLAFNAFIAIVLTSTVILSSGSIAMWLIILVGLFNSIMFANIFTLSMVGLGKYAGQGSGILCMAIVGGAIVPLIQGYFADLVGLQNSYFVPVLCYSYILYYSIRLYKAHAEPMESS